MKQTNIKQFFKKTPTVRKRPTTRNRNEVESNEQKERKRRRIDDLKRHQDFDEKQMRLKFMVELKKMIEIKVRAKKQRKKQRKEQLARLHKDMRDNDKRFILPNFASVEAFNDYVRRNIDAKRSPVLKHHQNHLRDFLNNLIGQEGKHIVIMRSPSEDGSSDNSDNVITITQKHVDDVIYMFTRGHQEDDDSTKIWTSDAIKMMMKFRDFGVMEMMKLEPPTRKSRQTGGFCEYTNRMQHCFNLSRCQMHDDEFYDGDSCKMEKRLNKIRDSFGISKKEADKLMKIRKEMNDESCKKELRKQLKKELKEMMESAESSPFLEDFNFICEMKESIEKWETNWEKNNNERLMKKNARINCVAFALQQKGLPHEKVVNLLNQSSFASHLSRNEIVTKVPKIIGHPIRLHTDDPKNTKPTIHGRDQKGEIIDLAIWKNHVFIYEETDVNWWVIHNWNKIEKDWEKLPEEFKRPENVRRIMKHPKKNSVDSPRWKETELSAARFKIAQTRIVGTQNSIDSETIEM